MKYEPYFLPIEPYEASKVPLPSDSDEVKWGPNAAKWLASLLEVLAKNRPKDKLLQNVGLVNGASGRRYLVSEWGIYQSYVDIHLLRWTKDSRPYLKFLRRIEDGFSNIIWPSGLIALPGEAPILAVYLGSGGSWIVPYRIELYALRRNSVDITPRWAGAITDIRDLDGDGQVELVTRDNSWTGYFDGRGSAGPFMFVILEWRNGEFHPACREHANRFADQVALYRKATLDPGGLPYALEYRVDVLLNSLQIADFESASSALQEMANLMGESQSSSISASRDRTLEDFADLITTARQQADVQCPGSAAAAILASGGHYGEEERTRHFSFEKGP